MKLDLAVQILEDCERKLRDVIGDAVKDGDYASVFRITELAKAVAALAADRESTTGPTRETAIPTRAVPIMSNQASKQPRSNPAGTPRKSRDVYPKFFRRDDELVKVGWSKRDRKEYSHRAPRAVVDAVANVIRKVGANGKLFNGEALLPVTDPSSGVPIPDYQAYVALAWLRHLGIVEQRGRRGGYTFTPAKDADRIVTSGWLELVEWRG